MNTGEIILQPEILRENLHAFWRESLEIATTPGGLELAVPQSYPDGWQIVLRLEPMTPTTARLSDSGKTLWQLAQTGQNIDAEVTALRLRELLDGYQLQRDGWDLFRFIPWRDLHDAHPSLLRVMLYDPAVQEVDSTASAIGESVCDYFGPYHETIRLHEMIDLATRR